MKVIEEKRRKNVRFGDLAPGQVYYTKSPGPYDKPIGPGYRMKCSGGRTVDLGTGRCWCIGTDSDDDIVELVEGAFVEGAVE